MQNILPSTPGCCNFWFNIRNWSWTAETNTIKLPAYIPSNKTLKFTEGRAGRAGGQVQWALLCVCATFTPDLADDSTSPLLAVQPVWHSRSSGVLHQRCYQVTVLKAFHMNPVKARPPRRQILKSSGELRRDITVSAQHAVVCCSFIYYQK